MFFSKLGEYKPAGLFGLSHIILIICTLTIVGIALFFAMKLSRDSVMLLLKIICVSITTLEILKDIFIFSTRGIEYFGDWVPLFFCGTFIFALILASFFKGQPQRVGMAFVTMGAVIGGLTFIFVPETSLSYYPAFHFISIHSFMYHGTMVFTGLLLLLKKVFVPKLSNIVDYIVFIGTMTVIAFTFNTLFDDNFMFLRVPVNMWPFSNIYEFSHILYSILFVLGQDVGIYLVSFAIYKLVVLIKEKIKNSSAEPKEIIDTISDYLEEPIDSTEVNESTKK